VRKCDTVSARAHFDVHDLVTAAQIDAELQTPPPEFVLKAPAIELIGVDRGRE
jgi:hypothetical protein